MKLPLASNPILHTYPVHLNHFSIIGRNLDYEAWMFSNYIQISCPWDLATRPVLTIIDYHNYDMNNLYYRHSPFSREEKTERITDRTELVSLVRKLLNEQKYLNLYLDDYYIPFRPSYNKSHEPHDLFFYGYDDDAACFHVLGYSGYGTPTESTLSYADFEEAYINGTRLIREDYAECDWMQPDYRFEYVPAVYPLNLPHMIGLFESYLNPTTWAPMPETFLGVDVYPLLKDFYRNYTTNLIAFDVRPFHMLWEHKMLMHNGRSIFRSI